MNVSSVCQAQGFKLVVLGLCVLILAFHLYILTERANSCSFHSPVISSEVSGSAEKSGNFSSRSTSDLGHDAAPV